MIVGYVTTKPWNNFMRFLKDSVTVLHPGWRFYDKDAWKSNKQVDARIGGIVTFGALVRNLLCVCLNLL